MAVNTKRIALLLLLLVVLSSGISSAKLFSLDNTVTPPFFGCSILGCTMQGDINMSGYNIYEANLVNPGLVEFDPIFISWLNDTYLVDNQSIWAAINSKYNASNPDGFVNYSFVTSTFYPLSNPNNYVNNSNVLINYSQITDAPTSLSEFVNDAGFINESYANSTYYFASNPNNYINATTLDNLTNGTWVRVTGDNMTGNLDMNNNNISGVDVLFVHNITGRSPIVIGSPIISGFNITADTFYGNIQGANGTIFGVTITNGSISNLRVNDSALFNTSLIPELNNTWSLGEPNRIWKDFFVDNLYAANISSPLLDEIILNLSNVKEPTGPYLAYNTTNFWVNESYLNGTINSIAEVNAYSEYLSCTTSSGQCSNISVIIDYEITQIIVTPTTPTNKFRFEMTEYPNVSNVIDTNRVVHNGEWNIYKNYIINSSVQFNITQALIDEAFIVEVRYLDNGLN